MKFKIEDDDFWWELLRLEEIGLPESWNFILPDKLFHFLTCFFLTLLFSKWMNRHKAVGLSMFIMIGLWEILWDGFFRLGFSYRDLVADLLGCFICWWWLKTADNIGQMDKSEQK